MALRTSFKPRSICLVTTNAFVEQTVPAGVTFVTFIAADGNVLIRINSSGNNWFPITPTTSAFEIPVRDDAIIEVRGENGGEKLHIYVR